MPIDLTEVLAVSVAVVTVGVFWFRFALSEKRRGA